MSQKIHRYVTVLTASILCATCLSTTATVSSSAESKQLLVLGDSISAGYGLAAEDYAYYDYLVECAGYEMTNLAQSGATTVDLLALVQTDAAAEAIAKADLISISIGANDLIDPTKAFLKKELNIQENESLMEAIERYGAENLAAMTTRMSGVLRPYVNAANQNIPQIVSQLRTMNPDVQIVMQTIYNPVDSYTTSYDGTDYSSEYKTLRNYVGNQEKRINDPMKELAGVTVVDINAAFDGAGWIYINSQQKDIHPTPLGHALIGAQILAAIGCESAKSEEMFNCMAEVPKTSFAKMTAENYNTMIAYCPYAFGDIDGNGRVESDDAILALRFSVQAMMGETSLLTAAEQQRANVCGDKTISPDDATMILRYYTRGLTGSAAWCDLFEPAS